MSPKAGAHGELCGMMAIRRRWIRAAGAPPSCWCRNRPMARIRRLPQCCLATRCLHSRRRDGTVDTEAFKAIAAHDVAGIMLTNPNTCGLFERDIIEIADAIHEANGYFYCDGANFNAIVGKVRPGDLGIDAMHINLHKTFSTPHGGGGPGSGRGAVGSAGAFRAAALPAQRWRRCTT
jgi:glycine dehydrogenase subunit 2